jgi:hypothetical protein
LFFFFFFFSQKGVDELARKPIRDHMTNRGVPLHVRHFGKQDPNREPYHPSSSSDEHEHEKFKEGRWARPKANFRFSSDENESGGEKHSASASSSSTDDDAAKQDGDRPEPWKVIHERVQAKYAKEHAKAIAQHNELDD